MRQPRRVILLIEPSRAVGRNCLLGVASYIRNHGAWQVLHLEHSVADELPKAVRQWQGDGVISRINSAQMARSVAQLHLPVVDLRGAHRVPDCATLCTDPEACARLAAEHFLERGFRRFAFCGYPGINFSDERCGHFLRILGAAGNRVDVFHAADVRSPSSDIGVHETSGELAEAQLADWLKSLPRPVAVFACNDIRGRQVLAACASAGLAVPDEVAVLGVDNDEIVCGLSRPALSSIEQDTFRLGYDGAAILDDMMAGGPPPDRTMAYAPWGIRVRQSSDVLAMEDPEVAMAVRYIRDHACEGITVERMVSDLMVSRTTLERRLLKTLGRSPKAEMERVRFERAKQLLAETSHKLQRVAVMLGFSTAAQFTTAFKRYHGCTPSDFRLRAKSNHAAPSSVNGSHKSS
ncbi:MAG: DNA-binding transcriptional regulator [Pirellulales bacterium]|nr:DNA-binding transcriptional regulator [Pirellulales bacterium]